MKAKTKNSGKKNEVYDRLSLQRKLLVDEVLKNLESGSGLWTRGWEMSGAPMSAITGKKYRGMNNFFLTLIARGLGYKDNRWATFKQIEEKGWRFKTDESGKSLAKNKGVIIEFFQFWDSLTNAPYDKKSVSGMSADERDEYWQENVRAVRKNYRVFNGDLIDGIPEKEKSVLDESMAVDRAEQILEYWSDNEAEIEYGGDRAYYLRASDRIHLPERKDFFSMEEFYATALHEIGHSTGHEKRLNRDMKNSFGSDGYALEELRAEIASMFLEQDLEISASGKMIENNSAYIKGWYEQIKKEPNILFTAIADAEKITSYIFDRVNGKIAEPPAFEEEKSEIYVLPSEIVARSLPAIDMAGRGIESLSKMSDRDIVERASGGYGGEKFNNLYNGINVLGYREKNERSLMTRIAAFCNGDTEQILRIFKSSGQYTEDKPNAFYSQMAEESIKFVDRIKGNETRQTELPKNMSTPRKVKM